MGVFSSLACLLNIYKDFLCLYIRFYVYTTRSYVYITAIIPVIISVMQKSLKLIFFNDNH